MTAAKKTRAEEHSEYRRKRRATMKRLGFVEVTLFVPKGELKALKKDLAEKAAVAKKARELKQIAKKYGMKLIPDEKAQKNKASPDVLAGQQRPATAAPRVSPAPQAVTPVKPPQSRPEPPVNVTMPAPYEPAPDPMRSMLTDPAPQPAPSRHQHGMTDREMDAMLANANGLKAFP